MDQFRNTTQEYADDLKQGKADTKDFERYVYGASFNAKRGWDEKDQVDDISRRAERDLKREAMSYQPKQQ